MADQARKWTDKELAKIEKSINKHYSEVEKELTKEWNKYAKKADKEFEKLENKMRKAWDKPIDKLDFTKISELDTKIAKQKELYLMRSAEYRDAVEQITYHLANANQIALNYINNSIPNIYAKNFSQVGFDIDNIKINYKGFHPETIKKIVNEDVIKNLIKDGDIKLQKKELNIFKDVKWNTKKMNSAVLQGIIKGESIQQMANRISPIVQSNRKSAIRNARTLVTGAENRGRNDSYKRLQDEGLVLKKVWLATGDGRTRDWHVDMDGQEVDPKESFIDGLGNELEYPGDPAGSPETVYNCRCSMITDIVGFKMPDGKISYVEHVDEGEDLHDIEIAKEKENRNQRFENLIANQNEKTTQVFVDNQAQEIAQQEQLNRLKQYNKWGEDELRRENAKMLITSEAESKIYGWDGYIGTSNSWDINEALRYDRMERLSENNKEVVNLLQETIQNNTISEDVKAIRMVGKTYMKNTFGLEPQAFDEILQDFDNYKDVLNRFVGTTISEKGFMSVSTDIEANVFNNRPVMLDIHVPKGHTGYVTENFGESEVIFGLNTEYEILGFEKKVGKWRDSLIISILLK